MVRGGIFSQPNVTFGAVRRDGSPEATKEREQPSSGFKNEDKCLSETGQVMFYGVPVM